jgi:8-oxo-dGTP pyrophosphatase MutT (NUDIX family)
VETGRRRQRSQPPRRVLVHAVSVLLLALQLLPGCRASAPAPGVSAMQSAEIMLCCPKGLRRQDVSAQLSPSHDRCRTQPSCEGQIAGIWETRLASNPGLYNGAKFRWAGFEIVPNEEEQPAELVILLGVTDYRDYIGTNLAPHWQSLLALDPLCPPRAGHAGRPMKLGQGAEIVEADARTGSCLANTCANAAVLETSDGHIVFLERSSNVGECPNMVVLPGGHAEPAALGIESQELWLKQSSIPNSQSVVDVLWDAVLLEVEEETGVAREELSEPLLLGVSRRVENHRPCMAYLVSTNLSASAVKMRYRDGHVQDRFESTSLHSLVCLLAGVCVHWLTPPYSF